jgi:putative Mg2+ transporter-C (MgtC) family protein
MMVYGSYAWALAPEGGRNGDALAGSSRIAQGVMTGIGFVGAGVIFKEGLTIQGLTSAASIWTTAAIGLLLGAGFWFPAGIGFGAVLLTLSVLRWAEDRMPRYTFFEQVLTFSRADAPEPEQVRALMREFGFRYARMRQRLDQGTGMIEYRLRTFTLDPDACDELAKRLRSLPNLVGFEIMPGDD